MTESALARRVADLAARVERLEERRPHRPEPRGDLALAQRLLDGLGGPDDHGGAPSVVYAGAGAWEGGVVAWQMERAWPDVLGEAGDRAAEVFGALASPVRVDVVRALLTGPLSTAELADRLGVSSSGQLFHHVKELLAAGLVHQPVRGTYAVRRQHVVPLLAALSCAVDLAATGGAADPSA